MSDDKQSIKLTTPPFRVSFPSVFSPSTYGEGDPKFEVVAIFEPKKMTEKDRKMLDKLKAGLNDACVEKFGKSVKEMRKKYPKFHPGFRKGSEKENLGDGYNEDTIFIRISSQRRPGLVDQHREPIISQDDFYPGCWARATCRPYAYFNETFASRGVSLGLFNLQKVADDERFGDGGTPAEDDFDDYDEDVYGQTSEDEFDDEIPF
jgi:hypothetical protein